MNKKWLIVGVSLIAFLALAAAGLVWAGTAYARTQTPPVPDYPYGMMGGHYGGFGMMGGYSGGYGPMHDEMVAALAEGLGLSTEDLEARLEAGETPWEIAASQGLQDEEIANLMSEAHDKALEKAVDAGLLTQEQADWMDEHMDQMWSLDGSGFGGCHGYGAGSTSGTRYNSPMWGGRQSGF
jgi:hypothetical protein